MEYKEILGILITIGVFIGLALVGVGIRYLCKWLATKTNNEFVKGIMEEIQTKCEKAVDLANQTYVNALKAEGKFDIDAQKHAFDIAYNAVLDSISDEAWAYIDGMDGEPNQLIEMLIESAVSEAKRWGSGIDTENKKAYDFDVNPAKVEKVRE